MANGSWKNVMEEPSKALGFLLFLVSAALMIIWLCLKFIFAGQSSGASIREIIAVILVEVLLTLIGAYLSTYRARYDLEIVRTIGEAVASLLAKGEATAKSTEELQTQIADIRQKLDRVETNQEAARYLIDLWERLARTLLESDRETIEARPDQAHANRQSQSTIDQSAIQNEVLPIPAHSRDAD